MEGLLSTGPTLSSFILQKLFQHSFIINMLLYYMDFPISFVAEIFFAVFAQIFLTSITLYVSIVLFNFIPELG